MRSKLIFITGVMALGLSACGVQGSDPMGGSSSSEVIVSAEAAVTEESTSETGESMEATVSTETVSDTTASTTGPSYEDEDAWLSWEDYGECSNTVKDFYNDDEKKTYYYEMDEFFFSDEKYAKVNDYLQQMYENYRTQYEEEGENHTGAYELVDETLSEGQRYDDNYLVFNGITLADDEYVSLHFNDTVYYAGAAHPLPPAKKSPRKKFWGRPGTRSGQQALLKKKMKKILMPITAFTSQRRNCAISIALISLQKRFGFPGKRTGLN